MWGVVLALTPVILGLLAVSAVFSAAETALTGAQEAVLGSRCFFLPTTGVGRGRRADAPLVD